LASMALCRRSRYSDLKEAARVAADAGTMQIQ
jgi:hypothetical protein